MKKEEKEFGIFKIYGIEEDLSPFVRNTSISNNVNYQTPIDTDIDKADFEIVNANVPRKTMLKVCNKTFDIRYTISATEDTIKAFLYFKDKQRLFSVLCKGWRELDMAFKFHKKLSKCKTKDQLKELIDSSKNIITF